MKLNCYLALVFGMASFAATPISTCTTITTPGNYTVTADISATGTCIVISASNVTVNLNGKKIVGNGTGIGVSIVPITGRLDHVGVSGPGLIRNFQNGITINNGDYIQVSSVTASGNVNNGINSAGTNNFLNIIFNLLSQNGIWGFVITASSSNFNGNDMPGNGMGPGSHPAGALRLAGVGNTVSGNIASGNGKLPDNTNTQNAGIVINTTLSRYYGNTVNGNNGAGIEVLVTGSGNQIFNNKALGNIGNDLQDDNANCGTDLWADNTFFTRNPASCVK